MINYRTPHPITGEIEALFEKEGRFQSYDELRAERATSYRHFFTRLRQAGHRSIEVFGELASSYRFGEDTLRDGCVLRLANEAASHISCEINEELVFPGFHYILD